LHKNPRMTPLRVAGLTLLVGLALTLVGWRGSIASVERLFEERFHARTAELHSGIESRFLAYTQVLRGIQTMVSVSGHPTRDDWARVNQTLRVEEVYPGLTGTVYIRKVPGAERAVVEAEVRKFEPNFAIKPPGERPDYAVVTSVEPRTPSNLPVIGSDSWAHPERRKTLEAARDSGEPKITGKLTLVIDDKPTPAFLMYQAIYRDSAIPATLEEKQSRIIGYAAAGCRVGVLMQKLLPPDLKDVALRIYDGDGSDENSLYFASHPEFSFSSARFAEKRDIAIGGRNLTVYYATLPGFASSAERNISLQYLLGGGAVSLLLTIIMWSLASTRSRAIRLAAEMTRTFRESERRFRELAENIDQVFFIAEPDYSRFHYLSPAFEAIWGREIEDLLRSPADWGNWIHPEDQERVLALLKDSVGCEQYSSDFRIIRADGGIRWISAHAFNLAPSGHEGARVVGFHADITAKKQVEAELQTARDQLSAAIESIHEGVALYDDNDKLVLCNEAYRRDGAGFTNIIPGVSFEDMVRDAYRHGYYGQFCQGTSEDETVAMRVGLHREHKVFEYRAPDGRWLHNASYPVRGGGTAVVRIDVTESKNHAEKIAAYVAEVERSNADLEQFAYIASHDLREPLRMVSSYLSLIGMRYGEALAGSGMEFLDFARDGAVRMDRLVQDLLEYAKIGRRDVVLQPLKLSDTLDEALRVLCPNLQDCDADIEISQSIKTAMVMGEPGLLFRLFQNLISNAIKYRSEERPVEIQADCHLVNDFWEISIKDNGIGIEDEYHEKIFGIFQRLHTQDKFEGTGIGLAIVRKIVDRLGGRIRLESTPGQGTTFFVSLKKAPSISE
jgi:PAS domain S-box-containing protein